MSDQNKCPKCGIEAEKINDCPLSIWHPTTTSNPLGSFEYLDCHIIDFVPCLKNQLDQANAHIEKVKKVVSLLIDCCEEDIVPRLEGEEWWFVNGVVDTLKESVAKAKEDLK